ncbi:hypothetical protein LINGRAHAP2_LOCUS25350 [Linum grandiflorum]
MKIETEATEAEQEGRITPKREIGSAMMVDDQSFDFRQCRHCSELEIQRK